MKLPVAFLTAAMLGAAAFAGVALVPTAMLESAISDSGLPAILPAAQPPLGWTARLMLGGGLALLVAGFAWFSAYILFGTRALSLGADAVVGEGEEAVPVVRRADAHPDAPPRAPLLATRDLGTPFLEVTANGDDDAPRKPLPISVPTVSIAPAPVPAEVARPAPVSAPRMEPVADARELPVDLDTPMAAVDPAAIPAVPRERPPVVPPLKRRRPVRPAVFDDSERFETFELTPPVRCAPAPVPFPGPMSERPVSRDAEATVHALLDRLEQGVVRRGLAARPAPAPRAAEHGLEEALVTLRNLARRA